MELVALEHAAYRAWPAAEVEALGAWRLRFTDGVTRRGNSAWTYASRAVAPATARGVETDRCIDRVEAFYAERGRPALFQLGPLSEPADLDRRLEARGYDIEAPVSVQTAPTARVCVADRGAPASATVSEACDEEWWALAGAGSRFRDVPDVYRALLARMPGRVAYARVCLGGETVATGLGVAEGAWLGVFSMLTAPHQRGRGHAGAILGALGRFAGEARASHLYLQVERDNPGALALYARAGFREVADYHYRLATGAIRLRDAHPTDRPGRP